MRGAFGVSGIQVRGLIQPKLRVVACALEMVLTANRFHYSVGIGSDFGITFEVGAHTPLPGPRNWTRNKSPSNADSTSFGP